MEIRTDPGSCRRSADTLVDNWSFGRQCAHDWVITHTLQKSSLHRANPDPALPLADAESYKISYAKEVCERRGIAFQPLAADSFGGFGCEAERAISKVSREAQLLRGSDVLPATHLRQRLQMSILKGLARQLLRRLTYGEAVDSVTNI